MLAPPGNQLISAVLCFRERRPPASITFKQNHQPIRQIHGNVSQTDRLNTAVARCIATVDLVLWLAMKREKRFFPRGGAGEFRNFAY